MERINKLFWDIGIPGHYDGCYPLKIAVMMVNSGECDLYLATQRLYPLVAARSGISAEKNERNIRTVIDVFWKDGGKEYLEEVIGREIKHKPTTKEFIDLLAGCLRHCEQYT